MLTTVLVKIEIIVQMALGTIFFIAINSKLNQLDPFIQIKIRSSVHNTTYSIYLWKIYTHVHFLNMEYFEIIIYPKAYVRPGNLIHFGFLKNKFSCILNV